MGPKQACFDVCGSVGNYESSKLGVRCVSVGFKVTFRAEELTGLGFSLCLEDQPILAKPLPCCNPSLLRCPPVKKSRGPKEVKNPRSAQARPQTHVRHVLDRRALKCCIRPKRVRNYLRIFLFFLGILFCFCAFAWSEGAGGRDGGREGGWIFS